MWTFSKGMSTFILVGKSGQRPAVPSLVVGHRGGRKEAVLSHVLRGGLSHGPRLR